MTDSIEELRHRLGLADIPMTETANEPGDDLARVEELRRQLGLADIPSTATAHEPQVELAGVLSGVDSVGGIFATTAPLEAAATNPDLIASQYAPPGTVQSVLDAVPSESAEPAVVGFPGHAEYERLTYDSQVLPMVPPPDFWVPPFMNFPAGALTGSGGIPGGLLFGPGVRIKGVSGGMVRSNTSGRLSEVKTGLGEPRTVPSWRRTIWDASKQGVRQGRAQAKATQRLLDQYHPSDAGATARDRIRQPPPTPHLVAGPTQGQRASNLVSAFRPERITGVPARTALRAEVVQKAMTWNKAFTGATGQNVISSRLTPQPVPLPNAGRWESWNTFESWKTFKSGVTGRNVLSSMSSQRGPRR